MNFTGPSMSDVGRTARTPFNFGRTYVVKPKGKHQATVVWLHGLGHNGSGNLANKIQGKADAAKRAAALPILLFHGAGDQVVPHRYGEKSYGILSSAGFQDATFKSYDSLGHFASPEKLSNVCSWLSRKLGLDGSS